MGIKDAVQAETRQPGTPCAVGAIVASLDDRERADLLEVLDGPAKHAVVARAMGGEYGKRISSQTVSRHRGGACCCDDR